MEVRYRSASRQRDVKSPPAPHYLGEQDRLDFILDKIKKSGYASLNDEEKKFLDDASQK